MAKSPLDVRLYRSSVKGRRPAAGDMAYGDLAVNYNHEDPALIIKGDNNALIEFTPGSNVTVSQIPPANAKDGALWWEPGSARLFVRYTSGTPATAAWVDASPAAVPPSIANALTYKGLVDPTAAGSAPAAPSVGDTYVANKAGAVATGWTGLAGSTITLHELLVWDGAEWDGAGTAATPRTTFRGVMDVTQDYPAGFTPLDGDIIQVAAPPAKPAGAPGWKPWWTNHATWTAAALDEGLAKDYSLFMYSATDTSWYAIGGDVGDQILQRCLKFSNTDGLDITQPFPATYQAVDPTTGPFCYTVIKGGTAHASYTGLARYGPIRTGEIVVNNGGQWTLLSHRSPFLYGALDPAITAEGALWWDGTQLHVAVEITPGTPSAGLKWAAIGGGAGGAGAGGLSGLTATSPISVTGTATNKNISIGPATQGHAGVVQLADTAALQSGTAGRVVDAAQLKAATVLRRSGTKLTPTQTGDLLDSAALPKATPAALGGVKVGSNLAIDANGVLSASLANVLTFKGATDPTAAPPASPKAGDTYVSSKAGVAAAGWTGLAGSSVSLHELLVWDGTEWDGAGMAAQPRTAWRGSMDITQDYPAGYTPQNGDIIEWSQPAQPPGAPSWKAWWTCHPTWKTAGIDEDTSLYYQIFIYADGYWNAIGAAYNSSDIVIGCLKFDVNSQTLDFTQPFPATVQPVDDWTKTGAMVFRNTTYGIPHASYTGLSQIGALHPDELVYSDGTVWRLLNSRSGRFYSATEPTLYSEGARWWDGKTEHVAVPVANDPAVLHWVSVSGMPDYGEASAGDVLTMVVKSPPAGFEGTDVDKKFGIPDLTHRTDAEYQTAVGALKRGQSFAIESGVLTTQTDPSMGFVFSLHGYYYKVKADLRGITDIHPSTWPANSYDKAPVTAEAHWAQGLPAITSAKPQVAVSEQYPPAALPVTHPINLRFGFNVLPPAGKTNTVALMKDFTDALIAGKTPFYDQNRVSINAAGVNPIGLIFNSNNNSFIQIKALPPAGTDYTAFYSGAQPWFKEVAPDLRWIARTINRDNRNISALVGELAIDDRGNLVAGVATSADRLGWVLRSRHYPLDSSSLNLTNPCNIAHGIPDVITLTHTAGEVAALSILKQNKCFYVGIDGMPVEVNVPCAGFIFFWDRAYHRLAGPMPAAITDMRISELDYPTITGMTRISARPELEWAHPMSLLRNFGGLPPLP